MFRSNILRRCSAVPRLSRPATLQPVRRCIQPFSSTSRSLARKDAQGKDDLKPEPNEYSKSGSDDEAARVSDTAFDPDQTSPEEQHDSAGSESEGSNPLNVSPANQDVSETGGKEKHGGSESSSAQSGEGPSDRERASGKGSPPKGGSGGKKYE